MNEDQTIAVTKDQLRQLQARRGWLEADSERIFLGVRGARDKHDGLWHLEILWADPPQDPTEWPLDRFSLREILSDRSDPSDPTDWSDPTDLSDPPDTPNQEMTHEL